MSIGRHIKVYKDGRAKKHTCMGQCRTRAMHMCIQNVATLTRPSKCVACLSSTVFWTSIASRGVRGALLGSHGSRRARSSGSRGVPVGLSWGSPRGFRRTFLGVRSGSRMPLVGLSSVSPAGSREALVGLFGARLGSVGLLISPCHLPSSSLLVILLLSSGSVRLRRAPPLSFSSPLGSVGFSSVGLETFRTLMGEATRSSHPEAHQATTRLLQEGVHYSPLADPLRPH